MAVDTASWANKGYRRRNHSTLDDYPVTPGHIPKTAYAAAAPPFPNLSGNGASSPPPSSGFVTKVNSTGTALLWSTYFGGSYSDQITGMIVTPGGEIYLSGHAVSSDLPALAGTPDACRPSANQVLPFVTRLAPDATTAGPTTLLQAVPDCLYFTCANLFYGSFPNYPALGPLALNTNGTLLFAGANGTLASLDFSAYSRLSCVLDPSDYVQLTSVAPGQLLSLFGNDLAPAAPAIPPAGIAPSTTTLGVFFNGIPAPILYSDAQQINVQVPYEIAGQSSVQMKLAGTLTTLPLSEIITLGVVNRAPSIYLAPAAIAGPFPGYTLCGNAMSFGPAAVALNADGTLNDCDHPAPGGTTVTLFLDGLGPVTPALATGTIAGPPPAALTPAVAATDSNISPLPSATLTLPGAITGASQLQLQLPLGVPRGPYFVNPKLEGTPLRERLVLIWTRPN